MLKRIFAGVIMLAVLAVVIPALAEKQASGCEVCRKDKEEVVFHYHDGSSASFCSLRCAFGAMAAFREKDVTGVMMRDHASGDMIDAKKAVWVVGGRSAPAVFRTRENAEQFVRKNGGRVETYEQAMKAVVSGFYGELARPRLHTKMPKGDDRHDHPECVLCGMDRKKYAYSRMLIVHDDGTFVGYCSINCAGIDLLLKPGSAQSRIIVGDYVSHKLIDAEKAVWVLGGTKPAVMSIRGKWAFEKKKDARAFIKEFGGAIVRFRDIMSAAYEDMWDILR